MWTLLFSRPHRPLKSQNQKPFPYQTDVIMDGPLTLLNQKNNKPHMPSSVFNPEDLDTNIEYRSRDRVGI